jgi:hypothetical protein
LDSALGFPFSPPNVHCLGNLHNLTLPPEGS